MTTKERGREGERDKRRKDELRKWKTGRVLNEKRYAECRPLRDHMYIVHNSTS